MLTISDEAAALRRLLESGILQRVDVVAWADRIIERSDSPDPAVCEIAVMAEARDSQIADVLRQLERESRPRVILGLILAEIAKQLEAGRLAASAAARWLYFDAVSNEETWSEYWRDAIWYDDEIYLIESGTVEGDVGEVRSHLLSFLDRVSSSFLDAA